MKHHHLLVDTPSSFMPFTLKKFFTRTERYSCCGGVRRTAALESSQLNYFQPFFIHFNPLGI
eukprot:scaffold4165_cov194-Ochromonas_danica.AAC.5